MKYMTILLALVVLFSVSAEAQSLARQSYHSYRIFSAEGYANSQVDTSNTYTIGAFPYLSLKLYFADSVSVSKINFDYRARGQSAWTASSDTIAAFAGTAAAYYEKPLRFPGTDVFDGLVDAQYRIRITFAGSNNGVTSATYNADIIEGR